jgi:dienelactone hydrolase
MNNKNTKYGEWISKITIDDLTSKLITQRNLSQDNGNLFWLENKPEKGNIIGLFVKRRDNKAIEITENIKINDKHINIGNRVNEYGGLAYKVFNNKVLISDKKTGYLILSDLDGNYNLISSIDGCTYSDFDFIDENNVVCIREDHRNKIKYPEQTIVKIHLDNKDHKFNEGIVLRKGDDFYAYPRYNKNTNELAFISWNLPNMPWDSSYLFKGHLENDMLKNIKMIAGNTKESVLQPEWSQDNKLYFISDRNNYWNIFVYDSLGYVKNISNQKGEIGGPLWNLGEKFYSFLGESDSYLVAQYIDKGKKDTIMIEVNTGDTVYFKTYLGLNLECKELPIITDYNSKEKKTTYGILTSSNKTIEELLIIEDLNMGKNHNISRLNGNKFKVSSKDISKAEVIGYKDKKNNKVSYMNFYSPVNQDYYNNNKIIEANDAGSIKKDLPPLIVMLHGGPTAMASTDFSYNIQFWTNRGFAVADLNYRGSTGFGREYRDSLNENWGLSDVNDAINAVKYLVDNNYVDKDKIAIRGSSAGGYSVLNALTKSDIFKAGVSKYGISDLKLLLNDTHKFEAGYLDTLIGNYNTNPEIYEQRSPINNIDNITASLLILQGSDDEVVPPNQANIMVEKLVNKGNKVAHYEFEGEGHGFRKPETIKKSIELELAFYGKVFDFKPYGISENIDYLEKKIENKI